MSATSRRGHAAAAEPHNLGTGWLGFDFGRACVRCRRAAPRSGRIEQWLSNPARSADVSPAFF